MSKELSKRATDHTLYILDEPSVGQYAADVHKLVDVLNRLVDQGNSLVIIEHHPDIKVSDWLIDLGPEGGERQAGRSWLSAAGTDRDEQKLIVHGAVPEEALAGEAL
ncbi:MAG: hypothetical protein U0559_07980 [Anaerolineae bacterium]